MPIVKVFPQMLKTSFFIVKVNSNGKIIQWQNHPVSVIFTTDLMSVCLMDVVTALQSNGPATVSRGAPDLT